MKTQCVLKCKSVDHKHVWMQREQAKRDGGRCAHKQGNGCVVVGDTVGMVVVAVCCGMDVECNRMWG